MKWNEINLKHFWHAFVVIIVGGGIAALVTKFSRLAGVFLDAALLFGGALLLVEAAFGRRLYRGEIEKGLFPGMSPELVPMKSDALLTRFGVALILAAIAGLLSLLPSGSLSLPPGQFQSLMQRLDKTESDLRACLKSKVSEKGCISIDDAAATKIEDGLHRLGEILKAVPPPHPDSVQQNGISPWGTILIVFLALGAAAGIIWLTLKLSPSKTPLVIAGSLAGAMITSAEHLPQPGGHIYYWCVVFSLLVAGAFIIFFGSKFREPLGSANGATASNPTEQSSSQQPGEKSQPGWRGWFHRKLASRPEPNSPLIIGFSLMLLASTLAYVGKTPDKSSPPPPQCPACPPSSSMKFKEALHAVQGFGTGPDAAKTQNLEQFKRELESEKFTEADLLLLLGSTDCFPVKKNGSKWGSNQALAKGRAASVRDAVNKLGLSGPPTIVNAMVTDALPQAESCSQALELRAVYPLLFRPQTSK